MTTLCQQKNEIYKLTKTASIKDVKQQRAVKALCREEKNYQEIF